MISYWLPVQKITQSFLLPKQKWSTFMLSSECRINIIKSDASIRSFKWHNCPKLHECMLDYLDITWSPPLPSKKTTFIRDWLQVYRLTKSWKCLTRNVSAGRAWLIPTLSVPWHIAQSSHMTASLLQDSCNTSLNNFIGWHINGATIHKSIWCLRSSNLQMICANSS